MTRVGDDGPVAALLRVARAIRRACPSSGSTSRTAPRAGEANPGTSIRTTPGRLASGLCRQPCGATETKRAATPSTTTVCVVRSWGRAGVEARSTRATPTNACHNAPTGPLCRQRRPVDSAFSQNKRRFGSTLTARRAPARGANSSCACSPTTLPRSPRPSADSDRAERGLGIIALVDQHIDCPEKHRDIDRLFHSMTVGIPFRQ